MQRSMDLLVTQAVMRESSDDLEVLAEIAERYPDTTFFRASKVLGGKDVEYTATEIRLAYEKGIEVR